MGFEAAIVALGCHPIGMENMAASRSNVRTGESLEDCAAVISRLSDLMVECGKTERIAKINDQFGIDEGAQGRAYFRKVLDDEGPVMLEVIRSLNIEPA